jgi:hypothetical protein
MEAHMINSYSKVYQIGHREILDLFDGEVVVQEKIDGSQFSFGMDLDDKLYMKSHHQPIVEGNEPKMFLKGINYVKELHNLGCLKAGWIYRAEYLEKPKQNALAYDRIPKNHLMLFDVDTSWGGQNYLTHELLCSEAESHLDLEAIPVLYTGTISSPEELKSYLDNTSVLGGQKLEGVVIKNYDRFTRDKKTVMGKYVCEKFKELNHKTHKVKGGKDIVTELGEKYKSEARWIKAMQHLREQGLLTDSPKDIGPLMAEINKDILEECSEEIQKALFKWAWRSISREVTRGFPQFYKDKLLEDAFKKDENK